MNIVISPTAYFIFLLIALLLAIQLAIITRSVFKIKKMFTTLIGDLDQVYFIAGSVRNLYKMSNNARKRDERLLREVHAGTKETISQAKNITDLIDDTDTKIVAGNRKITTIDGNVRRLVNDSIEDQSKLNFIKKGIEKAGPVLTTLEEVVKKAKGKKC
jgi:hypothetical protein